jgi:hypothetical protein
VHPSVAGDPGRRDAGAGPDPTRHATRTGDYRACIDEAEHPDKAYDSRDSRGREGPTARVDGSLQKRAIGSGAARDELKFGECLPVELADRVVLERLGDPAAVTVTLTRPMRIVNAEQP